MKVKFILLLLITVLLASCVNNKDESAEQKPDEQLPVTKENLRGTWQIYYNTKKINTRQPMRVIDIDGSTITFDGSKTFYEANAKGMKTINGEYEVYANDSVKFRYKLYNDEGVFKKDTATFKRIARLTAKQFVYAINFKDGGHAVEEVQYWRNLVTMPKESPEATKESVTVNRLAGEWIMKDYHKYADSDEIDKENSAKFKNTIFQFNKDRTYYEKSATGFLSTHGTYNIVDDVVHMYHKDKGQIGDGLTDSVYSDLSSSIQIVGWTNSNNIEKFTIYEGVIKRYKNTNILGYFQSFGEVHKVVK